MKRVILLLVLALSLMFGFISAGVSLYADDSDYVYIVINESYATITGYTGTDTNLVVPAALGGYPVQSIGANAFRNNQALTSVILPEGVLDLEDLAFEGCANIINISLPDSLVHFGYSVFANCAKLENINYPLGLNPDTNNWGTSTSIFKGCVNLKSFIVPEGVIEMPENIFRDSDYLESVSLPGTLKSISRYAFWDCTALTAIDIPEGVTSIGNGAFSDCVNLSDVALPGTLTEIGGGAFFGCSSLVSIALPDSITTLGGDVFRNCTSLESINYPLSLTTVLGYGQRGIFNNCQSLKSITVPEGVTAIPTYMFDGCDYLESIILPSTLESIGVDSFRGCINLKHINLSDTQLTSLGDNAFYACRSLESISLPDSITTYGDSVFRSCHSLSAINYPIGLASSGYTVYYDCYILRSITVPEGVTIIPTNAFSYSNYLQEVILRHGLISISDNAFNNCGELLSLYIPMSVTSIADNNFTNCNNLTIYCYSNTEAHLASVRNGWRYALLDDHTHDYIITSVIQPTCETDGQNLHTCQICGHTRAEVMPATGHHFGPWVVEKAPTQQEDGLMRRICQVCGYDETEIIPRLEGSVTITAVPTAGGIYGDVLGSLALVGGAASVEGTWAWDEPDAAAIFPVVGGAAAYKVNFIPADTAYEPVGVVVVPVMSMRHITVVADDKYRLTGRPNPELTFSVSTLDLVGSDTIDDLAVTLVCAADEASLAGEYPITGVSASLNYDVTVIPGSLTIESEMALYSIHVSAGEGGVATGGGVYDGGAIVTLIAEPSGGYVFDGWYENDIKISDLMIYVITITTHMEIQARFIETPADTALASITGSDSAISVAGATVSYTISAERMPPVSVIELEFEVDGDYLSPKDFTAMGGFSLFGAGNNGTPIYWTINENIWTGKVTLINITSTVINGDADILYMVFDVIEGVQGDTAVILNYIKMSWSGNKVATEIIQGVASTNIIEKLISPYDLNQDDVVDINDLAYALQYMFSKEGDANWDVARAMDFDGDGRIDIGDLVIIIDNYTIPYYS